MNENTNSDHEKLVEILAEAWRKLDAQELLKHIHPNFQYDSQWVFASMYAKVTDGKISKMDMCMF